MFDAAKALYEIKAGSESVGTVRDWCSHTDYRQSVNRACSIQPDPSHRVPKFSVINCQGCHANRCYGHILTTYHIHSVEALRTSLADITSALWHNLHRQRRNAYTKEYPQLRAAIGNGSSYPLVHRLAYYASNFAPFKPLNQAVTLGFYDTPTNIVQSHRSSVQQCVTHLPMPFRRSNRPHFAAPYRGQPQPHRLLEGKQDPDVYADENQVFSCPPLLPRGITHKSEGTVQGRRGLS